MPPFPLTVAALVAALVAAAPEPPAPAEPGVTPGAPVPAAAAAPDAPAAVPYAPGETMEFAVQYLGISTGKARISVGRLEGTILPVFLEARTSGALAMVNLKQQLASYLDAGTGLPRSTSIDSTEPGYRRVDTTRFDRLAGKATVREKGKFDNTYEIDVPPGTLDFVALVFRLRRLPLEPGARHEFQVLSRRQVTKVVAEVEGRETVSTRAGDFPAVRVRVPTSFSGKFSEKNPTRLWLSDDARRIVVQIESDFAVGHATAGLVSYRPGTP